MTYLQEWERQLERDLAEIRSSTAKLTKAAAAVRGRSEVRGISIEVDTTGDITSLNIAPGVMRWPSGQLTNALIECHRRARADAADKAEKLLRTVDPRIRIGMQELRGRPKPDTATAPGARPMTEGEIQAADDEYFERLNRGWETRG
ncbi:hypothetical protein [Nocardia sp. NPDC049149]|uniref:hypothetical protein n=1 Tax=Nocardia sp. NPDC049149 TaxID=3364315 RepID=UPI00371CB32F